MDLSLIAWTEQYLKMVGVLESDLLQLREAGREGGAEEQRLPLGWEHRQQLAKLPSKSRIQQTIGLVHDQEAHLAEPLGQTRAALKQILHPTATSCFATGQQSDLKPQDQCRPALACDAWCLTGLLSFIEAAGNIQHWHKPLSGMGARNMKASYWSCQDHLSQAA